MDSNELKKRLVTYLHDVKNRVRCATKEVLKKILNQDNTTDFFPESLKVEAKAKMDMAEDILACLTEFENILYSLDDIKDGNFDVQLDDLKEQIKNKQNSIVSKIEEIGSFFERVANPIYFTDSDKGTRAFNRVQNGPVDCKFACDRVKRFDIDLETTLVSVKLINIIEDSFDRLDRVTVEYPCTEVDRNVEVSVDNTLFRTVLDNIVNNIQRHAFPNENSNYHNTTDKKVIIQFELTDDNVNIRISNNGVPIEADKTKIFEYGARFGKTAHHGVGLCSARDCMRKMDGDIIFSPTNDPDYPVSFVISAKRSYSQVTNAKN